MHADRFDRLVIALGRRTPRRPVLGLLGVLGLSGLAARDVAAVPCLVNGRRCLQGATCCSGWCKRKRGTQKKFCRAAADQGICTIESNYCSTGSPECESTGEPCRCYVTSSGFSLCGSWALVCFACTTNADCERRLGGQLGDRCAQCPSCSGTNNGACVHKCPNPL